MLEEILTYERDAFLWLNGSHTPYWDHFMWLFSSKVVWVPLACLILFTLLYKKPWRETLLILLAIVLVVTLCDQFASHLCKPLFTRFRPTHHPDFVQQVITVYNYRGGLYGFMSSHASNAFGFSLFLSLLMRQRILTLTLFFWACMTAYSRIYLGVHFISDIVPGALVGLFWGWVIYQLYVRVRVRIILAATEMAPASLYTEKNKWTIVVAIWITISILLLLGFSNEQLFRP